MKITLVDPSISTVSIGARTISSYLKENGHKTQMIFLPVTEFYTNPNYEYPNKILDEVLRVSMKSDLVGFSLLSNFMLQGLQVSRRVRDELELPVIWGGAHPTIRPEECIEHADMVSIGESEEAVLDVANALEAGKPVNNIPNIWYNDGKKVYKNKPRPLESNLDKYPFIDYSIDDHHISWNNKLKRLDLDLFKEVLANRSVRSPEGEILYTYFTVTSRGCPHSCTYCCNNAFREVYGFPNNYVRRRSNENVMQELEALLKKYPFFGYIRFFDDTFMATPTENMENFARMYTERIGLNFSCVTSPITINEPKMDALIGAGLTQMEMGIQTGSKRTNFEIYKRNITGDQVIKAAKILNKYKEQLRPRFDIIMDNPYETVGDQLETARLLSKLPKPFRLSTFSLTFFPGTEMYERAKKDGIVKDIVEDVYKKCYLKSRHVEGLSFTDMLIMNAPFVPGWLTRALAKEWMASTMDKDVVRKPVNSVYSLVRSLYQKFVGVDYWKG